jgi:hypothetical protein
LRRPACAATTTGGGRDEAIPLAEGVRLLARHVQDQRIGADTAPDPIVGHLLLPLCEDRPERGGVERLGKRLDRVAGKLDDALHIDAVGKVVRSQRAEVRRHRDCVVRIVLGRDEVERLAHQGRPHYRPVVESAAQVLTLESLEPGGQRNVGGTRPLSLERTEPVNCGRHTELDALEQQLAGERGAVQLSQREHAQDGTTC